MFLGVSQMEKRFSMENYYKRVYKLFQHYFILFLFKTHSTAMLKKKPFLFKKKQKNICFTNLKLIKTIFHCICKVYNMQFACSYVTLSRSYYLFSPRQGSNLQDGTMSVPKLLVHYSAIFHVKYRDTIKYFYTGCTGIFDTPHF